MTLVGQVFYRRLRNVAFRSAKDREFSPLGRARDGHSEKRLFTIQTKPMSQGRRTIDRRRRVLYSAAADTGPSTAASRREQARLREARSPTATYGSRVRRTLRGRWFGLVPVRRRTMTATVGSIAAVTLLLCAAHYAAVAWPSIANRSDIARPLRLDRADSFGRWFAGILMIGSAGASFLIYQLRQHRLDDFRGHYRLWRLVLIVMALASLNSVVSLVDWSGALLDAAIGKRVALSGSDWIRIVVSVGGVVLMLRLIAEVRRSRSALVAMLIAAGCLAIPEAVKWNVMQVETIGRWALVTSAPLLAFTSLFLAFAIYLRMLYRQVRRLDESDRLTDRWQQMRLRFFQRADQDDEVDEESEHRRRWWQRKDRDVVDQAADDEEEWEEEEEQSAPPVREVQVRKAESESQEESESKQKRRWFGLRAAKADRSTEEEPASGQEAAKPATKKKRRFSLRLDPSEATEPESEDKSEASDEAKPKRKFGLGGFRRQRAEQASAGEDVSKPSANVQANSTSETYIDPDEIDWNGLSKAERRRLKKQLKRQNRAA